jgi:hypothetical protein
MDVVTRLNTKRVLGWKLNTQHLLISLPADKYKSWCHDIQALLTAPKVTHKQLEIVIGRLNHARFIIPLSHHFLSCCLRNTLYAAEDQHKTSLRPTQVGNLQLWLCFLQWAHDGISLNLLSFHQPTWRSTIKQLKKTPFLARLFLFKFLFISQER